MSRTDVADRLSALYASRGLRSYARWKVRTDPVYEAVLNHLRGHVEPLLDLGCGVGLLPFYLREHGYTAPIVGIDFDERKIGVARLAAQRYQEIDFIVSDVRVPLPASHNVVILDVLHYLETAGQQQILANARDAVPPGGVVILRQGIRDRSWRHRLTVAVDAAARAALWMRGERLNVPTLDEVVAPFDGFAVEVRPLWGRMPYNNYLFVFTKQR